MGIERDQWYDMGQYEHWHKMGYPNYLQNQLQWNKLGPMFYETFHCLEKLLLFSTTTTFSTIIHCRQISFLILSKFKFKLINFCSLLNQQKSIPTTRLVTVLVYLFFLVSFTRGK